MRTAPSLWILIMTIFALSMCRHNDPRIGPRAFASHADIHFAITKESVAKLKSSSTWEVSNYEDSVFKGWTLDEVKRLLGAGGHSKRASSKRSSQHSSQSLHHPEIHHPETHHHLPREINWARSCCNHEVRSQGDCGSCWAFAVSQMLGDRCCLRHGDQGLLSPQELLSCDKLDSDCDGGWCTSALDYVRKSRGLVREDCMPYQANKTECPRTCADCTTSFRRAHVCNCVGGYTECTGVEGMKKCLASGPITAAFEVCNSFFAYKNGIYKCDCGENSLGLHAVEVVGYFSHPECHFLAKNSWGTDWGINGYFKIGCNECGISGDYPEGNVACLRVGH